MLVYRSAAAARGCRNWFLFSISLIHQTCARLDRAHAQSHCYRLLYRTAVESRVAWRGWGLICCKRGIAKQRNAKRMTVRQVCLCFVLQLGGGNRKNATQVPSHRHQTMSICVWCVCAVVHSSARERAALFITLRSKNAVLPFLPNGLIDK